MIIPCVDVMGGKVVQLIQGQRKALELGSVDRALEMFRDFPLLHVIDLDAALGQGQNADLVRHIVTRASARVGGGLRSVDAVRRVIDAGAEQAIVGTAAFAANGIHEPFLRSLVAEFGRGRIVVAIDCKKGQIAVKGWRAGLDLTPREAIQVLAPYCGGFLCTYVDNEGTMQGTDLALFRSLRKASEGTLIAAGGIASLEEVEALVAEDIQVALGMAAYTGKLNLADLRDLNRTRSSDAVARGEVEQD